MPGVIIYNLGLQAGVDFLSYRIYIYIYIYKYLLYVHVLTSSDRSPRSDGMSENQPVTARNLEERLAEGDICGGYKCRKQACHRLLRWEYGGREAIE